MPSDKHQNTLDLLRREFVVKLVERLGVIEAAMTVLKDATDDTPRRAALKEIQSTAHLLSGSSALFGYPEVGETAQDLELACQDALDVPTQQAAVDQIWAKLKAAAGGKLDN